MELTVAFGDRLSDLLNKSRFTETSFANLLGVSRQTVNNWINSKVEPRKEHRDLIAQVLGVRLSTLLDDDNLDAQPSEAQAPATSPEQQSDAVTPASPQPPHTAPPRVSDYMTRDADPGYLVGGAQKTLHREVTPEREAHLRQVGRRLRWAREIATKSMPTEQQIVHLTTMFRVNPPQVWSMWEDGSAHPDCLALLAFCRNYGFTMDWLLMGKLDGLERTLQLNIVAAHSEAWEESEGSARP